MKYTGYIVLKYYDKDTQPIDTEKRLFETIFLKPEYNIEQEDKTNKPSARNLKKDKIIQYIDRLRADTRRLTSESISKEVEKLDEVYRDACTKKQYSAAVNAIRLKSQLLGFLVEKKEVQHSTLDAMSDDDMAKYLDQIKQENDLN
jgi:hypothetical protein